ncbi:MAG: C-terminal binding protein [Dehalococcoidia bacterium]
MSDAPFLAVQTESADPTAFEIERSIIEPAGGRLVVQRAANEEERAELLAEADCALISSAKVTQELLEQLPNLKLVVRYGVGLDTLDIPAITEQGIVIAHYPDFCQPEVANHALMLLLAAARKLVPHDRTMREGRYRGVPFPVTPPLTGQTMGIVAFGAIGREFAHRAQAIGMDVVAFDPYTPDAVFEGEGVTRATDLDDLLQRADHISIHAPLTPETHHMFSHEQFARMKPGSIIVNTARGPIIDEPALVEALTNHTIAAAGLDVFEVEPLPADSPLLGLDNVVLTPHSGSYSERSNRNIKERVGKTVVTFMQGRWPDEYASIPNRQAVQPRATLR